MADSITPIYVGQRKPVEQWTWTRDDGSHPPLQTGGGTLSRWYYPSSGPAFQGTGAFSSLSDTGTYQYARSAADVAGALSGTIQDTYTYPDGTSEVGDAYPFVIKDKGVR